MNMRKCILENVDPMKDVVVYLLLEITRLQDQPSKLDHFVYTTPKTSAYKRLSVQVSKELLNFQQLQCLIYLVLF